MRVASHVSRAAARPLLAARSAHPHRHHSFGLGVGAGAGATVGVPRLIRSLHTFAAAAAAPPPAHRRAAAYASSVASSTRLASHRFSSLVGSRMTFSTSSSPSSSSSSTNPLLANLSHPPFASIEEKHIEPAWASVLSESQLAFAALEAQLQLQHDTKTPSATATATAPQAQALALIARLEEIGDRYGAVWEIIGHLSLVRDTAELRAVIAKIEPGQVAFSLKMAQSVAVYDAFQRVRKNPTIWNALDDTQKRIVESSLQQALLSGVGLKGEERTRFNALSEEIATLQRTFSNNVLDSTKAWSMTLTKDECAGLPDRILAEAAQRARTVDPTASAESGPYRFSLDEPSLAFMKFSENRDLRHRMWAASSKKATTGSTDNTPILTKILLLRKELANLLGYPTYADMNLSNKLVKTLPNVNEFMEQLLVTAVPAAVREQAELTAYAKSKGFKEAQLLRWDIAYWGERMRRDQFNLDSEKLRYYFPLPHVLSGMFSLAERLFGVTIRRADGAVPVWHEDVQFFQVSGSDGKPIASFYLDAYARPKEKRQGAWMAPAITRRKLADGSVRAPVTWLACNQSPPVGDQPSLMSVRDVETVFHEFGHALQHMLTRVDYSSVSGIRNVEWDAVELPSQFMENFIYDRATLKSLSSHVDTKEPLPDHFFDLLLAARKFRAGFRVLNQLHYSISDMVLHSQFPDKYSHPYQVPRDVALNALANHLPLPADSSVTAEEKTALQHKRAAHMSVFEKFPTIAQYLKKVTPETLHGPQGEFLNSFLHIFGGGYSANYYSYLFAEVMSADAYGAFEEAGLSNGAALRRVGDSFRSTVLGLGGAVDGAEVFRRFRGRAPSPTPLLQQLGLLQPPPAAAATAAAASSSSS